MRRCAAEDAAEPEAEATDGHVLDRSLVLVLAFVPGVLLVGAVGFGVGGPGAHCSTIPRCATFAKPEFEEPLDTGRQRLLR
jgi:hypothetical protein